MPEIWRYDGQTLKVLILGASGKYREKSKSAAFPSLPLAGFARFVEELGSKDEVTLIKDFTEWVRAEVVAKKTPNTERKNGKKAPWR